MLTAILNFISLSIPLVTKLYEFLLLNSSPVFNNSTSSGNCHPSLGLLQQSPSNAISNSDSVLCTEWCLQKHTFNWITIYLFIGLFFISKDIHWLSITHHLQHSNMARSGCSSLSTLISHCHPIFAYLTSISYSNMPLFHPGFLSLEYFSTFSELIDDLVLVIHLLHHLGFIYSKIGIIYSQIESKILV